MRIPEFWLGDEAAFESLLRSYLLFNDQVPQGAVLLRDESEETFSVADAIADRISAVEGDVGVVNINGPLVAEADFWALLMGSVPYPAIDRALEKFSSDDSINSILLNIGTNGGDAVGVDETANKIQLAGRSKPVVAWSGSRALSAGYWLGASAQKVYGTQMAEFGSIGVVTTHTSMSRMLKERGLDVTVVRSGKHKALGHPAEQLSDTALSALKEKSDKLYGFFLDHVASSRGLKLSNKESWAEGRTFFGQEAQQLGLIDSVTSLSDLVQRLHTSTSKREVITMPKQVYLSQEAAAAVASGASLEQVPHEEVEVEDATESLVEGLESAAEVSAKDESSNAPEGLQEPTELVSFLREELASERAKLNEVSQKLAHTEALLAASKGAEDMLLPIVIEATQRMMVGLNQTPLDMDELPAGVVASQYTKVKTAFESRFKVGRQSLSADETKQVAKTDVTASKLGITRKEKGSVGSYPTWS